MDLLARCSQAPEGPTSVNCAFADIFSMQPMAVIMGYALSGVLWFPIKYFSYSCAFSLDNISSLEVGLAI